MVLEFREYAASLGWKATSFGAEKKRFKIRALLLSLIVDSALLADDMAAGRHAKIGISTFESILKLLQTELNTDLTDFCIKEVRASYSS